MDAVLGLSMTPTTVGLVLVEGQSLIDVRERFGGRRRGAGDEAGARFDIDGAVCAAVGGGVAASRFHDVVDRWNTESVKLHAALQRIAETIRLNQQTLREAADSHSHQIGAVATNL